MEYRPNRRILVIDDNLAIHADFAKTLREETQESAGFQDAEAALFDDAPPRAAPAAEGAEYLLEFASQGLDGLELLRAKLAQAQPFAVAFVDVRMPPGIDGVETVARLWEADPELQCV